MVSLVGCTTIPKSTINNSHFCSVVPRHYPIAENVYIDITPEHINTNKGGEQLIRTYAKTRDVLRELCGE